MIKLPIVSTNLYKRIILYGCAFLVSASTTAAGYDGYVDAKKLQDNQLVKIAAADQIDQVTPDYRKFTVKIKEMKTSFPEIVLTEEKSLRDTLKTNILEQKVEPAKEAAASLDQKLETKEAEAKQNGTLTGTVLDGTAPLKITLAIQQGEEEKTKADSGDDGKFNFWLPAGRYTVFASPEGYNSYTKEIEITAEKTTELEIKLTKPAPATEKPSSTSSSSSSASTAPQSSGNYSVQSVSSSRGSFTIHLLTYDLSSTRVIVDTAADGDCSDGCPVKSLSSFVGQNGGSSGIHGTYFCPTSYSSCAGKTNSFYYKLYNSRIHAQINWGNGLGDYLPFLRIDTSGRGHYHSTWAAGKDSPMTAAISCRPKLVENGSVVLTDGDLDSDKERSSKISRGFIGLKGQTIYAGVVLSATMHDSAAAVQALGLDYAFNLDGGGSTALYYNGVYKVGPGRDIPNAIVFAPR